MGGIVKILFSGFLIVGTLFVQSAAGTVIGVEFDFDDAALPYLSGAAEIEAYMEAEMEAQIGDQYPSYDVTVLGGVVGNGWFHGPLHDYPGDHYIQAGPGCGTQEFSFLFEEVPITAVSFEWAVRFNEFRAFANDVEIFSSQGWNCWTSGSFETVFDSPVTTLDLTFRDSGLGEIEVDDLVVTPVPEPGAITLLAIGGALMFISRRRTV